MNPLMWLGSKKDLELDDLFGVPQEDESEILGEKLQRQWERELKTANILDGHLDTGQMTKKEKQKIKTPSLLKAIIRTFGGKYALTGILAFIEECVLKVAQPVFMALLIRYFSGNWKYGNETYWGWLFGTGVILCSLLYIFTHHALFFIIGRCGMQIRVACGSIIYRKALKLSKCALSRTTSGQMVNLLSNDVNRFDQSVIYLHYLWIGPIQAIISTVILWLEFGISSLSGIAFLILFASSQGQMGRWFSRLRSMTAKKTDERVQLMNEILNAMRVIKMYAWEKPFAKMVDLARENEINVVRRTSLLRGINIGIFYPSSKIILLVNLIVYLVLGNELTAAKVFLAVAVYNNIRMTMTYYFPFGVAQAAEAVISIKRLQEFLLHEELRKPNHYLESSPNVLCDANLRKSTKNLVKNGNPGIEMKNAIASWTKGQDSIVLKGVSVSVKPGQLVAVIGPVGNGKVWMQIILPHSCHIQGISALLKEALSSDGFCADRALYQEADIYLLDDPLSAVDARVGRHLFNKCIMGYLKDKPRILVTHQLQFLQKADVIIVLSHGKVATSGTYDELLKSGVDFTKLMAKREISQQLKEELSSTRRTRTYTNESLQSLDSQTCMEEGPPTKLGEKDTTPTLAEEMRSRGSLSGRIYWNYLKAGAGWFLRLLLIASFILTQTAFSGSDWWLSYWFVLPINVSAFLSKEVTLKTNAQQEAANRTNGSTVEILFGNPQLDPWTPMYIYVAIVVALFLLSIFRTVLFFHVCMNSSINLHSRMFKSVLRAPVTFFDNNPVGRILNRFSKDVGASDDVLPPTASASLGVLSQLLGITVLLCIVNYYIVICTIVVLAVFSFIRHFYLNTARDLKRLESITRSPVFSHLSASLNGLATIRASHAENIFMKEFDKHQVRHKTSILLSYLVTRENISNVSISRFHRIFILPHGSFSYLAPDGLVFGWTEALGGDVGLAISSAIMLTGMVQLGVRQSAELENQMVSVERIMEYSRLKEEAALESPPDKKPPLGWPSEGHVKFEHVSLRYDPDSSPVLKDLTFTIAAKEKVCNSTLRNRQSSCMRKKDAIILCPSTLTPLGRTGAGKSSLITALFRLTEPEGKILLDGRDTKATSCYRMRKAFSLNWLARQDQEQQDGFISLPQGWQPWLRSNKQLFAPSSTTSSSKDTLREPPRICAAFKGNVVHYSTVSRWFKRLESSGPTFGDRTRSGRPSTVDDEALRNALNAKPNATTRELATSLGVTHMAIGNHLNDLGYRKKVLQDFLSNPIDGQAHLLSYRLPAGNDIRFQDEFQLAKPIYYRDG
ncbi:unnamed protein product, partial [Darwinula stevensoni]